MGKVIRCFIFMQSICVLVGIFILRFFDYAVSNALTVMLMPLMFIAMLITIFLSLLISFAGLLAYKAQKGSLAPIWINLITIFMLFLPIREWGIRYNFDMHYEQRSMIIDKYGKGEFDEETYTIMPQAEGDFLQASSNDKVIMIENEGKLCFFFTLYDGILGTSEGFIYVADRASQPLNTSVGVNRFYQIKDNWYFGAVYSE